MKTTKVNWNVKKMSRMTKNESLNFNYPIQRAGGQWDALQKSLLIHSVAGDYPVPPVLLLASDDIDYVLDGKQRILNIMDFVAGVKDAQTGKYPVNAYPLHVETPNVSLPDVDGEFELASKYFDELSEEIQSEIMGANMSISRLEDATDEEIEELFYRWNNGTPLTKQQKARAKMGVGNATVIDALQKHSFLQENASFTALQRRRSDDEAVVIQAMMLFDEFEIESFVADKILQYASNMRDADITEVTSKLKDALDYAKLANTNSPMLKKLHLPTLLVVAKKAKDEGLDPIIFEAWVDDFNIAINNRSYDKALVQTGYKNFTGAGSVKKDKVEGRMSAMLAHYSQFVKEYEIPAIEENVEEDSKSPSDEQVVNEMKDMQKELAEVLK